MILLPHLIPCLLFTENVRSGVCAGVRKLGGNLCFSHETRRKVLLIILEFFFFGRYHSFFFNGGPGVDDVLIIVVISAQ